VSVAPRGIPATAMVRTTAGASPLPLRMTAMELCDPLVSVRNDQPPFAVTTAHGWPGTRSIVVRILGSAGADAFDTRQPGGDSATVLLLALPPPPPPPLLLPPPRASA